MTSPVFWQGALLLGALLPAGAIFAWFVRRETKRRERRQAEWEQEQQTRWRARYEDTEEGLREWLTALGLPQLEERTRLEAAARQLRTVLSERLMKMPRVY